MSGSSNGSTNIHHALRRIPDHTSTHQIQAATSRCDCTLSRLPIARHSFSQIKTFRYDGTFGVEIQHRNRGLHLRVEESDGLFPQFPAGILKSGRIHSTTGEERNGSLFDDLTILTATTKGCLRKKKNSEGIAPFVRHRMCCRLLSPPHHRVSDCKHPCDHECRGESGDSSSASLSPSV